MNLENITILISDDSILARKHLSDTLRSFGVLHILEATNGQDCIDLYKEHHPNLVFLDIIMPIKDGMTATKEIMNYDSNAVIIIVSSIGTQAQLRAVLENGAKDFIQKPPSIEHIKFILESKLG